MAVLNSSVEKIFQEKHVRTGTWEQPLETPKDAGAERVWRIHSCKEEQFFSIKVNMKSIAVMEYNLGYVVVNPLTYFIPK
jgi:hypothetical protein